MNKERLYAFRAMLRETDQLREQIDSLESRMYSPKGQILTDMPKGGGDGHSMDNLTINHLQLIERYRGKLSKIEQEQIAIEEAIEGLPTSERMVIRYRYFDCRRWEDICVRMSYSWPQIHRIHASALRHLETK